MGFLSQIFELVSGFLKSSNESSGKSNSEKDKPQHVNQPTFSSTPLQSPPKPPSSKSSNPLPHTFSSRPSTSSTNLSPSPPSLKPPVASSRSYASVLKTTEPPSASSSPTSKKLPQSSPSVVPNSSTLGLRQTSTKQPPAFKPILHTAPNNVTNEEGKMSYMYEKGTPLYAIPEDIEGQIKRDIVPQVLKQPLSPSTYKAFFAALLYAEDYYLEKWTDFLLEKVTLKLEKATVYKEKNEHKYSDGSDEKDDKIFVAFEIDSVPQRRPFLLSRDMVYAQPSDKEVETFQGFIYRVVKSNCILVEFGDDFHSQHHRNRKYDISFSFNRVCLKRAHQAVDTAIETSSQNFIFPECVSWKNNVNPPVFDAYHELNIDEFRAVRRILSYPGSPPYLLVGPLIGTEVERYVPELKASARTGVVVCEAVIEIYKTSEENRVLICAPINHTCDALMTRLMEVIPESDMFRANAAFREMDGVPSDILRSCPVKDECFECPPLTELQEFKIILSTYVSSFRLYNEGIAAGHFSHIFLVDASSTTEPEAAIALANFANENTSVIVTGAPRNHSGWVRSNMARNYGLRKSYFERLCEREPYKNLNPMFITELDDWEQQPDGNHSSMSFY
ncbi:probable RNA helicase SDE3 [Quercus lobata]|uniref:Helicase MOV-10-like beta-barrel domain-containing protein n=1 Tax=Quercus lobata TaxID=97700 RepID=A0A7N2LJE6_QUELO|nr:probable RNA helicase SDE3 [Quercus lobata]